MLLNRINSFRLALGVAVGLSFLRFTGCAPMAILDTRAVDYRALYRGAMRPSSEVVVVAIDEASITTVGRWPWPRGTLARLLRNVCTAGPRAIGVDLVNSEPSLPVDIDAFEEAPPTVDAASWRVFRETLGKLPSEDAILAAAIRDCDKIVLGYFFDLVRKSPQPTAAGISEYNLARASEDGKGELQVRAANVVVANLPELTAAARSTGYLNSPIDLSDGHLRRLPMVLRYNDRYAVPLALSMLRVANPGSELSLQFKSFGVARVQLNGTSIPVDEAGRMTLNPRGPGGTFETIPAAEVLSGRAIEALAGKLVVVGVTATALVDVRPMAFDGVFPGVEVHATALDNILAGDMLHQPRWIVLVEIASIFLFVLLLGRVLEEVRGAQGALLAFACVLAYLACSQWLFEAARVPLGLVYPVAAIVLTYALISVFHFRTEQRARQRTSDAFGRYLTPELARIASENPEALKLGGDKRTLTVLFSDIRGFTGISENLEPEVLVEMLNEYLTLMTDAVHAHHGMIDKYVGDAVVAIWGGLPEQRPDHAILACKAALSMLDALDGFIEHSKGRGWPNLEIGVGIHTGEMIVGNMGSADHLSYTVIGDNVNLGSRLEGLTKTYGVRAIVSEATVVAASGGITARELDRVAVMGKRQPVRIFELVPESRGNGAHATVLREFESARAAYDQRNWEVALARFEAILEHDPSDGPSRLFAKRCREFTQSPPSDDWEGVTVMDSK